MQEKRKHGKKPRISEEAAAILVVSQPHGVPIIGTAPMDVLPRKYPYEFHEPPRDFATLFAI